MTIDKNILSTTEAPQSSQPAMSKKKRNLYTESCRSWVKVWAKVRVRDTVRDHFLEETRTT